jgi:hypothetical protein
MYLNLHAQVAIGDLGDDASDFPQRFLESLVRLLMLAQLSLEYSDILMLHLVDSAVGLGLSLV